MHIPSATIVMLGFNALHALVDGFSSLAGQFIPNTIIVESIILLCAVGTAVFALRASRDCAS